MNRNSSAYETVNFLLDIVDAAPAVLMRLKDDDSHDVWEEVVERFEHELFAIGRLWTPDHAAHVLHELGVRKTLPTTNDLADALAYSIDSVFWNEYADDFSQIALAGLPLEPGTRFPRYDRIPGSEPEGFVWSSERDRRRTGFPPGTLPHVSKWIPGEALAAFKVTLHGEYSRLIAPLVEGIVPIGSVHPHRSLDELSIPKGRVAFPVEPVHPKATAERSIAGILTAAERGARIVVLPECCQQEEHVEAIIQDLPRTAAAIRIICVGSSHIEDGEHGRSNVATTVIVGRTIETLRHYKFNPFRDLPRLGRLGKLKPGRREGIAASPPHHIDLYEGRAGRLGVMICKDLLHDATRELIDTLGITVLLVPAMSTRTDQLVDTARSLASDLQVLTIVANGPLDWGVGQERHESPDSVIAWPVQGSARFNRDSRRASEHCCRTPRNASCSH
jgi:predicted amidohydrolase